MIDVTSMSEQSQLFIMWLQIILIILLILRLERLALYFIRKDNDKFKKLVSSLSQLLYPSIYFFAVTLNYRHISVLLIILLRCVTNQLANQIISILFYIVIVLLEIILLSDKVLLSVKGFLEYGIFQYIQLLGVIILLLLFLNGEVLTLVALYIIVAFLWFGYSICVNNKVSTIVNELLSAALAILVLIKDLIVSALPTEILNVEYELPIIDNIYKYTGEQLFQLVFNCLVTPFLIINIIALVLCTVKGYWIEKYNDGKDITEDMLPDDIEQKNNIDIFFNRFIYRK